LAYNAGPSSGTYNLSGGSVLIPGPESIGYRGSGAFNQSGGTHTVDALTLGAMNNGTALAAAFGTYAMSNAAVLNVRVGEVVGDAGVGIFTQTGGTHTAAGLRIGNAASGAGQFNLSASTGPSSLLVATDEYVGNSATGGLFVPGGAFFQSGGSHVIGSATQAASLFLGFNPGSTAEYNLSGGSLSTSGDEIVGYAGTGSYVQSGGTNLMPNFSGFQVAFATGSHGNAFLSGGTLSVGNLESIGFNGTGTFLQPGGSNSARGLLLGGPSSGSGTFTLSGGVLTISIASDVGFEGAGSFNQSGGTHITGALNIGLNSAGVGYYTMTNGTLTVLGDMNNAAGGSGMFQQFGGTTIINGMLSNNASGSLANTAFILVSGGSITAASTSNRGIIDIIGGAGSLGPVSGTNGQLQVGDVNGGAAAVVSVRSFAQSQVIVRTTGTLRVASNAARVANTATLVTIQGNGTLDLGNNDLVTPTPVALISGYLTSAYTANGDWSGQGLTSTFAIANPVKYSIGYANGLDQSAVDAGIDVQPGYVKVQPVLVGDANMDGNVNFFDITQLLGYKYNTGQPASYTDGDLNYDGVVDFFDLSLLLSANYNTGETFGPEVIGGESFASAEIAVPEPTVGGFWALVVAVTPLLVARRRRVHCPCQAVISVTDAAGNTCTNSPFISTVRVWGVTAAGSSIVL
jgi:hypothetical protein